MDNAYNQRVGFVSARYIEHPEVGPIELSVLVVLAIHADRSGICWPSQTTIAALTKLDRSTVNRVIGKLVNLGFVEKSPSPHHRTMIYRLLGHDRLFEQRSEVVDDACDEGVVFDHTEHSTLNTTLPTASEIVIHSNAVLGLDWAPTGSDMSFATAHRPDITPSYLNVIRRKFVSHYCGSLVSDPSAIFRRWVLSERIPVRNIRSNHHMVTVVDTDHSDDMPSIYSSLISYTEWNNWIKACDISDKRGILHVSAPTKFMRDWIDAHYRIALMRAHAVDSLVLTTADDETDMENPCLLKTATTKEC